DDRLKGIRMQYLPQTIWRKGDKDRAAAMIQAIDKMLNTRRIMRSLEQGTKFLNKTLNAFFKEEGIEHQTSTTRTPKQNGIVERRNHTLVEAAQTMLSASKLPLFFWAEAIATACYHLQKQLDKDEFQEDGSMKAFWGVNNQFQEFIDSQVTLDYDSQMTKKYFVEYTRIKVKHFKDTLLQHMGNVKKSVFERARHQRQYDRRVNKRLMQTQESKIDMGEVVNDDLVVTESSGTESEVQDDNSRSGNDTNADDADIRPIYDEEPMAKVQLTAECNIFAIGQQHTEQPEIINEGRVDQYPEQCQVKSPMFDSSLDSLTNDYSIHLLESENSLLKQTVA
nr:putative ribonuclease H-like domain-containing protein [Tanacetum cinerariifolium]